MRVLFFGTYDATRHPRVQVLQEGLADAGIEVVECNAPLDLDTSDRVRILRQPWRAPQLIVSVRRAWRNLRRAARTLPPVDAVLVGYLGHLDVALARRLWPTRPIVLDHLISLADTAADRRAAGWVERSLARIDRRALARADVVLVDTEEHLSLLPVEARSRGLVVAVGAPEAWFHDPRPPEDGDVEVVFFGVHTPLQGTPVIGRAIGLLAGEPLRFTMVGTGQDFAAARQAARRNRRVDWIKWVDPGQLPDLVARHRVCLGIFGSGPKALRVVPNKVFQGAAAGCAVVTSDTSPQRRALEEAGVFVSAGDAEALAEALRALARDPVRLEDVRTRSHRRAEERFRPRTVIQPLVERLERLRPA